MLRIPVESRASRAVSAWVEVDLGAIAHNTAVFRAVLPASTRLLAVVKSDGYGHGMLRVARTALQFGAEELVVASVEEGASLRASGVHAPILIAGPVAPEQAAAVVQHGLVVSLGNLELASALARATRRFLPVQVEVDTGMTRHGVAPQELEGFIRQLEERGKLAIAGLYTHFSGLGDEDLEGMRSQNRRFVDCIDSIRSLRGVRRHACNTVGAMLLPAAHHDAVRIGGGIYGFDPRRLASGELRGSGGLPTCPWIAQGGLRPALSLKAKVVGLRDAEAGDRVGYGGSFVCQRRTRLALLPIGYGDGLVRDSWRGAEVLLRGRRAPIVGAVSMNQAVVDVTELPPIVLGEEVVLLGAMGDDRVWAEERAGGHGCAYEVTSVLQARLPRVYFGALGAGAAKDGPAAWDRSSQRPRGPSFGPT